MGWTDGPAFTLTRRLYTNDRGTCVTNEIVCWGSNPVTGSLWKVNLRMPPRLGVCARPSGTMREPVAPAATVAPPSLSKSLRVITELGAGCSMAILPVRNHDDGACPLRWL